MFRAKIRRDANKCGRCKHTWFPRTKALGEALVCPKCKSRYWNKKRIFPERKKKAKAE